MGTVSLLTPVGKDVFLFRWQPSFLWSDACKKARKCNSPHTRLSLNLTSTCWSIFSKFSPCDPQVKDQGGYLHPAHPCVNHSHLKMKVTNKLQLYLYSAACPIFSTSISLSLITATSRCPPSCFVYPRLSVFVFLPLSFWACKALNVLAFFFYPVKLWKETEKHISALFKLMHGYKSNKNSLLHADRQGK